MAPTGVRPPAPGSSTRDRVFAELLSRGPLSAAELAQRLGLTTAGVRRHLEALVGEGSLAPRDPVQRGPRGRGRPAQVYGVTESGRDQFRKDYDQLALAAIAELVRLLGAGGVDRVAQAHFAPLRQDYARRAGQTPPSLEQAARMLADALDEAGYVASLTPVPSGEQLCQHHCPVPDIARAYPQLCQVETELISQLLRSRVQRLATIAHGDGVCTTHIPSTQEASL